MSIPTHIRIAEFPFHIGPADSATNPAGLPATFPFELRFEPDRGLLVEVASPDLDALLGRAYGLGLELGTPLADDPLGRPYVEDFLAFLGAHAQSPGHALEIGAGVGYTSRCLLNAGWNLQSIEPGQGYERHWKKYGLDVINEFFPSARAQGPYDLIVSYAVLEHIPDVEDFLKKIRAHLSPGGNFIMAVPDCGDEIAAGDPAMLIHEHFNYFEQHSLGLLLGRAGFTATVEKSRFGRSLYAACKTGNSTPAIASMGLANLENYPARCAAVLGRQRRFIKACAEKGSVGIYCPTRALAVLSKDLEMRFFDDGALWKGKYIPPFPARIETRAELLGLPVDHLFVMSRTFGRRIKAEFLPVLPNTRIYTIGDIIQDDGMALGQGDL